MKVCKECLENKTNDKFYRAVNNIDMLNNICKICFNIKQKLKRNGIYSNILPDQHRLLQMENHKIVNANIETDRQAGIKEAAIREAQEKQTRADKIKELMAR